VTSRHISSTTTTTTTTTMAMATATATRSTATMARTTRAMAATARAGRGARASGARAMKMPMKMTKTTTTTTTTTTTRAVRDDDEDAASEPEIVEPSAMREPTTTTTPDATSEVIRVETRAEGEYELRQTTTPKRFAVADGELLNVATAAAPIALRWTSGLMCHGYEAKVVDGEVGEGEYAVWSGSGKAVRETSDVAKFPRPEKPLKMYQFQGCPFCKKVREAVISLDLDVIYYPCPRDGPEYREFVRAEGGRAQFPYLVDDNTGTKMYESDDIIAYMYEKYGPGKANIGPALTSGTLTSVTAGLALLPRLGKGSAYAPSKKPENMQPIVFYGYEGSPFCVLVAEKLCELELPYLQRSCGRGSPKRQELFDKRGTFQVPYIEDPNTGIAMFESKDIVNYLQEQYAA
jgi:glutathione S-transferase